MRDMEDVKGQEWELQLVHRLLKVLLGSVRGQLGHSGSPPGTEKTSLSTPYLRVPL